MFSTPRMSRYQDCILGMIVKLTVRAFIYGDSQETLDELEERARRLLNSPNGYLEWYDDDGTTLRLYLGPENCMSWGLKPSPVEFTRTYNGRTDELVWTVTTEIPPPLTSDSTTWRTAFGYVYPSLTPPSGGSVTVSSPCLETFYTIANSIDQHGYNTRTYNGVLSLIGAREYSNAGFDGADTYKATVESCIAPTPMGWHRKRRDYQMSDDGLQLTFAVTDQQLGFNLPAKCTDGDVNVTIVANPLKAAMVQNLRIHGFFQADRYELDAPQAAFDGLFTQVQSYIMTKFGATFDTVIPGQWLISTNPQANRFTFDIAMDVYLKHGETAINGGTITLGSTGSTSTGIIAMEAMARCANGWADTLRNQTTSSYDPGPQGTSDVAGYSGKSGTLIALPVLKPGLVTDQFGPSDRPPDNQTVSDNTSLTLGSATIVGYNQAIDYTVRTGVVVIPTMDADGKPKSFQIHQPMLYVNTRGAQSSSGTATLSGPPSAPYADYDSSSSLTLASTIMSHIRIDSPKPPNNLTTINWTYEQVMNAKFDPYSAGSLSLTAKVPYSPAISSMQDGTLSLQGRTARSMTLAGGWIPNSGLA